MALRTVPRLSDLTTSLLDPHLRKKLGFNVSLLENWREIVGVRVAQSCEPVKIIWHRSRGRQAEFEPATLVIACEGYAAIVLMHEKAEVIGRINSFFGFTAINKLQILQRPVAETQEKMVKRPKVAGNEVCTKVSQMTAFIEDDGLRRALNDLGQMIMTHE